MHTRVNSRDNLNNQRERKYSFLEYFLFPPTKVIERKLNDSLQGKTVLITGASFGIGESLTKLLFNTGAHLILVSRTEEKLDALKKSVEASGGSADVFAADLRDDEQINVLIAFLMSKKQIDYFINNAGKSIRRPLVESLDRYHDFSRTMAINYEAPVKLMLALLPKLKQSNGQVINMSAVNVLMAPAPYWAAYQASKTAFDQWFQCAAPEIEKMGVSTTSIYLPLVKTRMIVPTKEYDKMPAMTPEHVSRIIGKYMITRKSVFKPWWSIFGELATVLFRNTWKKIIRTQV